jgi:hypothetical protein
VHVLQPIGHVYKQLLLESLYPELHVIQLDEVQTAQFSEHAMHESDDL